jgi:hypothetical protein
MDVILDQDSKHTFLYHLKSKHKNNNNKDNIIIDLQLEYI